MFQDKRSGHRAKQMEAIVSDGCLIVSCRRTMTAGVGCRDTDPGWKPLMCDGWKIQIRVPEDDKVVEGEDANQLAYLVRIERASFGPDTHNEAYFSRIDGITQRDVFLDPSLQHKIYMS